MAGYLDKYEVSGWIHEGTFTQVMKAEYKGEGKPPYGKFIALKYLKREKSNARMRENFRKEAEVSLRFHHPNVVKVYEIGEYRGDLCIIMEYVPGTNLARFIREKKFCSLKKLVFITQEICQGLAYIHEHGVVHKDVKPENILLTKNCKIVKITDFGVAKLPPRKVGVLFSRIKKPLMGERFSFSGTDIYASPEQRRTEDIDQRSDIFSLGVVINELFTEKLRSKKEKYDFANSNLSKLLRREGATPRDINPSVPPEIEKIVLKATHPDPGKRYGSVKKILEDLRLVPL